jgi:ferric-dicitrate binding protein FerR (iron transport regulator)
MKPFRDILSRFRRETQPSERAVARVKHRIGDPVSDQQISRSLLQQLPGVDPHAPARVRARLAARQPARTYRAWAAGGVVLAAAAAGLTVVVILPDPGLAPVQAQLEAADQPVELAPSPEVALAYTGTGSLEGTRQAPRIAWEAGTVHVDVEPHQGIQLVVATAEAQVEVVGTAFDVTRDALGTQVLVEHGRVRVTCHDGVATLLGAGEHTTCLPTTAHGMLARARALQDQGASQDLLLTTASVALERHPEPSLVNNELQLVRIEALYSLGRESHALERAGAYLDSDAELRRDGVLTLATRLAWSTGGCDAASPWLEQLAVAKPSVPDLVKLAECQAALDPVAARGTLEQARALDPSPRWAEAIELRIQAL